QAELGGPRAIDVDLQRGSVDHLMQVHVDGAWDARHPGGDIQRDLVDLRLIEAGDLDVDRRREAEVENLAHHVRGLEEEGDARELWGQRRGGHLHPAFGGPVALWIQRDGDFPVRGPKGHAVREGEVDRLRLADVVDDRRDLVLRNDATDGRLDVGEDLLGL